MLKKIWENTDSITKWIQVVALCFAAIWTFTTFRETQAPSLETPGVVSGHLEWQAHQDPPSGFCSVSAIFSVENQGIKPFDVASAKIRFWRITMPARASGYHFFNLPEIEDNNRSLPPRIINSPSVSPLIGRFPPKKGVHDVFEMMFYGPSSTDWVIARIDTYDKSGNLLGQASAWSEGICPSNH